jgi:putative chitinase
MAVTKEQLLAILPYAKGKVDVYLPFLNAAMDEFEINTPARQAAFIAQIGHESAQFRYVEELASGAAYEGRADLGNTMPGDGVKYKGRGLIQITGKVNYIAAMLALNVDCVSAPEMLEHPDYACRSAAWFWKTHGLNELADAGAFEKITRRINGGLNGQDDRLALWNVAKKVLGE